MTDFLLELRSEEIPARMQAKARNDLARPLDHREQHSIAIFKLFALEARLAEEALERLLGCVRARAFQFFSSRFRRFRHIADDQH